LETKKTWPAGAAYLGPHPGIRTADLALPVPGRRWLPVHRHWRLNERHYGRLDKKETAKRHGMEQLKRWRRSDDTPPPAMPEEERREAARDPRHAGLPPDVFPATECVKHVVRLALLYWEDAIVPDLGMWGPAMAPCWWWPTATRSGRWASTSTASLTKTSLGSRSRRASPPLPLRRRAGSGVG
jgi:Histidine phosphatase superfamily (branch 1)